MVSEVRDRIVEAVIHLYGVLRSITLEDYVKASNVTEYFQDPIGGDLVLKTQSANPAIG